MSSEKKDRCFLFFYSSESTSLSKKKKKRSLSWSYFLWFLYNHVGGRSAEGVRRRGEGFRLRLHVYG